MEPTRFPFANLPTGWFVVAFSGDLRVGEVVRMRYFDRDLVAYRGESGQAYVTDAYCPHLGAHLGHGGTVEGDSIRCPFHRWRFDGDGRCVEIPYSDTIPREAQLGSLPVREQNGVVHVFHDPAGGTPWALPELDEEGWTPGRSVHWPGLKTHAQEVFENTVDMAHIGPIHDGVGAKLIGKPRIEGERMEVDLEFEASGAVVGMPDQMNDVQLSVALTGLGVVIVHTHVRNVSVRARQRIYATPVDRDSIDIRAVIHVRETDDPEFTEELATIFHKAYVEDFAKDFPIWENKRYLTRPRLAKGDGPIVAYRHWCKQFYGAAESAPSRATPREEARRETSSTDTSSTVPSSMGRRLPGATKQLVSAAQLLLGAARRRLSGAVPTPTHSPAPSNGAGTHSKNAATAAAPSAGSAPSAAAPAAPTPTLRIESAQDYFDTLEERFVPDAAKGVDAVFQWELGGEGGQVFHAEVRDGALRVAPGPHDRPTVSLVMGADDYVRVVNGELDGMRAFTTGKGRVKGSLSAAMMMRSLFPA